MNGTIRTLYVEGERGRAGATAEALESAGCDVIRAEGGADGLGRLTRERVDCVVCAGGLQRLSVATFVRRVASTDDAPPVVLFGDDPERAIRGFRAGAAGYVSSGLDAERELVERVREVVAQERARSSIDRNRLLASLSFEVLRRAVATRTRSGVREEIRAGFAASDLYRVAMVGEFALDSGVLELAEPVRGEVETAALASDGDPVRRAVASDEVVRVTEATGNRSTLGIVPLADRRGNEGVVVLGSDRPGAFDHAEREILRDLGEALARVQRVRGGTPTDPAKHDRRLVEEMAHELRSLVGMAATQLTVARESEAPNALDRASRAIERIDRTFENVLAIADGDPIDGRSPGNLADDAASARERIDAPGVDLDVENAPTIRADHDAVVRLLVNLFRNAAEHASTSGPTRWRSSGGHRSVPERDGGPKREGPSARGGGDVVEPVADGAENIESPRGNEREGREEGKRGGDGVTIRIGSLDRGFYVEDDGPGIPPDERDRVFEWGYSTAGSGVGIGLAVVGEIVEAHGWEIEIRDGRDGGARFEISGVDVVDRSFDWDAG